MDLSGFRWVMVHPKDYDSEKNTLEITASPHTDQWQKTYYLLQNFSTSDALMETEEKFFSFTVKMDFSASHNRLDQCGIIMYLDSTNWLKCSIEYQNKKFRHIGFDIMNNEYSQWIPTTVRDYTKSMWYRFSRINNDCRIECSADGISFSQMRICHLSKGSGKIRFGFYACSPKKASFKAVFTDMQIIRYQTAMVTNTSI